MNNFVLITSVINTPNTPLSYSAVRSVFTRKERYEQTKKTIKSIKKYIPNCKIMIVECTDFTKEESDYINDQCDYVVNLWHRTVTSQNIQFIKASSDDNKTLNIIQNRLSFKHLFKYGRYWINKILNIIFMIQTNLFLKKQMETKIIFLRLFKIHLIK